MAKWLMEMTWIFFEAVRNFFLLLVYCSHRHNSFKTVPANTGGIFLCSKIY